jgi:hypothetical protein
MMHRYGWTGPRASSNTAFAWFVWDDAAAVKQHVDWFDWQNLLAPEPLMAEAA